MGMGFTMFFQAMQGREFSERIDINLDKIAENTREQLRKDWRKITSSGVGWAKFTFFLVLFETHFEVMRGKDDRWNSFWGGGVAGTVAVIKSNLIIFISF